MSLDTNSAALNSLIAEINALPGNTNVGATNLLNYLKEEAEVVSSNRFDPSAYTPDVVLNDNGVITTNTAFCSTGYIHCRKGQKIILSRNFGESGSAIIRSVEFFDINKNRLSWASSTSVSDLGFAYVHTDSSASARNDAVGTNTVDGSYYIRCYFPKANLNAYMVQIVDTHIQLGTSVSETTPYSAFQRVEGICQSRDYWYGKKLAFDGDSITYGYGNAQRSYAHYTAEALGCQISDTAIGGSTLAVKSSAPTDRDPLIDRLNSLDANADAVIINIGSNDWQYSWTPMGDMTGADKYTFYGALKLLCADLLDRFRGKPIVLCTPIKRVQSSGLAYDEQNSYGKTLKDYADAIKEVAEYYGIPVCDLYSECLINPKIASHKTAYFANADGVHPNAEGHTIIARRLKAYLIQLVSSVRK